MKTCLALGTFDGVHIGHQAVIRAAAQTGRCVAVTFDRPPKAYLHPDTGLLLCDVTEKQNLLTRYGAGQVDFLAFPSVRHWSAASFFAWLIRTYEPAALFCGENYTFGQNGSGNAEGLRDLCRQAGVEAVICPAVCAEGQPVSSSRIRDLLGQGSPEEARALLGRPFAFSGTVVHGDARGRTIGFPTMNVAYPTDFAPVKRGVYAADVVVDGQTFVSVCNIGLRPTFPETKVGCEAYLPDYSGDAYGKTVTVRLRRFIREEKRFDSLEALTAAMRKDLAGIR